MAIPLHQKIRVGAYVVGRHLRGVKRYRAKNGLIHAPQGVERPER